MGEPLVVDLHLDLAWDAIFWNRNLTLDPHQVREQEASEPPQVAADISCGLCTATFPELRRGRVGVILSTIMSRINARGDVMRDGMQTQEQAIAMGRGHLAYYQMMVERGEIKPVGGVADLEEAVKAWTNPGEKTPIYHILSMESADPIIDLHDVEFWWDAGLRVVGPAHFGDNTYIQGTGTEGGLKAAAAALYKAMREKGMILDITHMADQAVWESFEIWDGPILASHRNCRSLIRGQRHLNDDMIRELFRRGGIMGLVFCHFMFDPDVVWETQPAKRDYVSKYTMEALLPHVEHLGNLAGGSLEHIAIGTDIDGGFGAELTPTDVDTIADVSRFGSVLQEAGYSEQDAEAILSGNALRFFRKSWQGWNDVSSVSPRSTVSAARS